MNPLVPPGVIQEEKPPLVRGQCFGTVIEGVLQYLVSCGFNLGLPLRSFVDSKH